MFDYKHKVSLVYKVTQIKVSLSNGCNSETIQFWHCLNTKELYYSNYGKIIHMKDWRHSKIRKSYYSYTFTLFEYYSINFVGEHLANAFEETPLVFILFRKSCIKIPFLNYESWCVGWSCSFDWNISHKNCIQMVSLQCVLKCASSCRYKMA